MTRLTGTAPSEASLTATVNCYRFQCGLPVSRYSPGPDDGERLIMLTGHSVDVIGMPARLGERVLRGLRVANLAGPVLVHDADWLFLCRPVGDSRPELRSSLTEHGVYVISRREAVTVPAELSTGPTGWVLSPLPRCTLPPWQAILATARRNLPATDRSYPSAA